MVFQMQIHKIRYVTMTKVGVNLLKGTNISGNQGDGELWEDIMNTQHTLLCNTVLYIANTNKKTLHN